jgi:predicted anti-sigma-YlaC factor YlaD
MRLVRPQHTECDSAREAISLALDDMLSELEQVRLRAHLEHCASCRSLQSRLGEVTAVLRGSEPEQPEVPIVLPRRRRGSARLIEAGAVAAAIGVLAATVLLNGLGQRRIITTRGHSHPTAASASTVDVRVFSYDPQPVSETPKRWHAA